MTQDTTSQGIRWNRRQAITGLAAAGATAAIAEPVAAYAPAAPSTPLLPASKPVAERAAQPVADLDAPSPVRTAGWRGYDGSDRTLRDLIETFAGEAWFDTIGYEMDADSELGQIRFEIDKTYDNFFDMLNDQDRYTLAHVKQAVAIGWAMRDTIDHAGEGPEAWYQAALQRAGFTPNTPDETRPANNRYNQIVSWGYAIHNYAWPDSDMRPPIFARTLVEMMIDAVNRLDDLESRPQDKERDREIGKARAQFHAAYTQFKRFEDLSEGRA